MGIYLIRIACRLPTVDDYLSRGATTKPDDQALVWDKATVPPLNTAKLRTMISIAACTGYKYYGGKLPLTKDSPWFQYRDNMLYLCLAFSDWEQDEEMLRFVLDSHVPSIDYSFVQAQLAQFVTGNQTPFIHLLFMQDDHLDFGELRFWIGLEIPEVDMDEHGPESAPAYIERKRAYYTAELARRDAELQAEEQRRETQTQARNERRLIREAKKLLGPK